MECSLSVEFHVVRYLLRCRIKVLKKASIKKKSSAKRRHMGALDLHAIFARYRVHPSFSPLWPCHFLIKILLTIEVSQVSHLILILVICIQSWNIYIYISIDWAFSNVTMATPFHPFIFHIVHISPGIPQWYRKTSLLEARLIAGDPIWRKWTSAKRNPNDN